MGQGTITSTHAGRGELGGVECGLLEPECRLLEPECGEAGGVGCGEAGGVGGGEAGIGTEAANKANNFNSCDVYFLSLKLLNMIDF